MVCFNLQDKRVLILGVLLRFIEDTVSELFSVDFLLNFGVVIFSLGLFQIHSQVVELLGSRRHVGEPELFLLFFEKVVRSTILKKMCGVLVFVFAAGRFDGEVAFLFVFDQFDVFIFDIYDGRFFILTKEIVLFLVIFNPSERLDR